MRSDAGIFAAVSAHLFHAKWTACAARGLQSGWRRGPLQSPARPPDAGRITWARVIENGGHDARALEDPVRLFEQPPRVWRRRSHHATQAYPREGQRPPAGAARRQACARPDRLVTAGTIARFAAAICSPRADSGKACFDQTHRARRSTFARLLSSTVGQRRAKIATGSATQVQQNQTFASVKNPTNQGVVGSNTAGRAKSIDETGRVHLGLFHFGCDFTCDAIRCVCPSCHSDSATCDLARCACVHSAPPICKSSVSANGIVFRKLLTRTSRGAFGPTTGPLNAATECRWLPPAQAERICATQFLHSRG